MSERPGTRQGNTIQIHRMASSQGLMLALPDVRGFSRHDGRVERAERLVILHGDRKGPPIPMAPPSPLLYTGSAAPTSYSSGEGGWVGSGGPLRSPCWWLLMRGDSLFELYCPSWVPGA